MGMISGFDLQPARSLLWLSNWTLSLYVCLSCPRLAVAIWAEPRVKKTEESHAFFLAEAGWIGDCPSVQSHATSSVPSCCLALLSYTEAEEEEKEGQKKTLTPLTLQSTACSLYGKSQPHKHAPHNQRMPHSKDPGFQF